MSRCWAQVAQAELEDTSLEIASMYLEGPESHEYRHADVQRAFQALGIDVDLADIRTHRAGKCECRA